MKRFFITMAMILSVAISFSQGPPTATYTPVSTTGYNWIRGYFRSLHVPAGCGFPVLTGQQWRGSGAVYMDTCNEKIYMYMLGVWRPMLDSTASISSAWSLTGNAGTNSAINFLGTTDNVALRLRINNIRYGYFRPLGSTVSLDSNYVGQIYLGHYAGNKDTLEADGNLAIGNYAMYNYPSSASQRNGASIAIGHMALYSYVGGGSEANTAIGWRSMAKNETGYRNVGIGLNTLHNLKSGLRNTGLGTFAGEWHSVGSDNTFVGESSARLSTGGTLNVALGNSSGYSMTGVVIGATNITSSSDWTTATVVISAPDANPFGFNPSIQATGTAVIDGGQIVGVTMTNIGAGYTNDGLKTITFVGDGTSASADIVIAYANHNTHVGATAGYSNRVGYRNTYVGIQTSHGNGSSSQARQRDTLTTIIGAYAGVDTANAAGVGVKHSVAIGAESMVGASYSGVLGIPGMSWGIGTSTPSRKSVLDLTSTERYFLPPRMNTTQQNAIASPEFGAKIYNTDSLGICIYTGSEWRIAGTAALAHFNKGIQMNRYASAIPSINTLLDNGMLKISPTTDVGISLYRGGTDFGGNTHVTYRTNNVDIATKTALNFTQTMMQWVGYVPGSDGTSVAAGYHMRFRAAAAAKTTSSPTFFELLIRDTIGTTGSILPKLRIWPWGTIIGDNVTSVSPDPGAVLTLSSTNKGFKPPSLTSAEAALIPTPGDGVMYYNTDSARYMLHSSGAFKGLAFTNETGGTSGVTTMTNIGSSPNADGATISGSNLTLQPADGSFGGVVSTTTQTFAGNKTFSGITTFGNYSVLTEIAAPSAPSPGVGRFYGGTDKKPHYINSDGTNYDLTAAALTSGYVGFGSSGSLTGSSNLQFNDVSVRLSINGVVQATRADFNETASMTTPAAGFGRFWVKDDGTAHFINDAGVDIQLGSGGASDHGTLTGLGDDDHTQYPLSLGRTGGQTLIGGIGSGDDLTFSSTSHGTKGNIFFGSDIKFDETNGGAVTIGPTSTIGYRLHLYSATDNGIVQYTRIGASGKALYMDGGGSANLQIGQHPAGYGIITQNVVFTLEGQSAGVNISTSGGAHDITINPGGEAVIYNSQFETSMLMKDVSFASTPSAGYSAFQINSDRPFVITDNGDRYRMDSRFDPLYSNVTSVGNVGAGEDDLMTYSIPASTLAANGDYIDFEVSFTFAANANSKNIKVYFGATQIYASGAQNQNGGNMIISGRIYRTGATSQRCVTSTKSNTTLFVDETVNTTAAETLSGAITIKATGEAVSNDDITNTNFSVNYIRIN
jgi:hypothetical protein